MKKRYLSILLPFLISFTSYAQNLTVDFSACTNSDDCRLFWNNAPTGLNTTTLCNGATIFTTHGSPRYFTSSKRAVELESAYSSSYPPKSFEGFAIAYSFKAGYSYQFKITATGMPPQGSPAVYPTIPTLNVSLVNSISPKNDGCGFGSYTDNGDRIVIAYNPNQYTVKTVEGTIPSPIPADITIINYPSLTTAYSYLSFRTTTSPGFQTDPNYQLLIYKVEIIETKSQFDVSQSSGSITCQTQTSKTFTVNNPKYIPGVTGYNWDLGAQPNGWIYNGSPAPQIINTTSNTLTLQNAISAPVLNSPTVTVMVNNTPWASYTSSITYDACPCLPYPSLPTNFRVTDLTHNSAVISWDPQPGVSFYGSWYGYSGGDFSTTTNSYTMTGLIANSSYSVMMSAFNCHGTNGSVTLNFTTLTCPAPTNVTMQNVTGGLSINWNPILGGAQYYELSVDNLTNPSSNYCCGSYSNPPALFTFVNPGDTYQASLQAVCAVNNYSSFSTKSLPITYCPATAGTPYGQPVNNSIYLYLPTTPPGCLTYNLKYRVYGTTQEYIVPNIPTTSPYILTNLAHGSQYQFSLQSNCSTGSSSLYGPWSQTPTYYPRIGMSNDLSQDKKNLADSIALDYHQDSSMTKTSIDKFSTDNLILYPNPAGNAVTVSFENQEKAKSELIIVNSLGKEVLKKNLANLNSGETQSHKINVSKLSNGIYIVKLKLGSKVLSQKFVIQR